MASDSLLSALPRSLHGPCLWKAHTSLSSLRVWFRIRILLLPIFIVEVYIYVFYSSVRLEVCHAVEASVLSILPSFTEKVLLVLNFPHYSKNIWKFNKICILQTAQHLTCYYTGTILHRENMGGCSSFTQITLGAREHLQSPFLSFTSQSVIFVTRTSIEKSQVLQIK